MISRIVKEHIIENNPVTDWVVGDDYHNFHKNSLRLFFLTAAL